MIPWFTTIILVVYKTAKDGPREIEATFKLLAEAFAFLDKNGDGMLERKDFVVALNEAPSKEKSPTHISTKRFSITLFVYFCVITSDCC